MQEMNVREVWARRTAVSRTLEGVARGKFMADLPVGRWGQQSHLFICPVVITCMGPARSHIQRSYPVYSCKNQRAGEKERHCRRPQARKPSRVQNARSPSLFLLTPYPSTSQPGSGWPPLRLAAGGKLTLLPTPADE